MIYDLVDPMLITLQDEFHVDSLPIFNSLADPQLKLLKKLTLSTAVQNGVVCGGFQSVTEAGERLFDTSFQFIKIGLKFFRVNIGATDIWQDGLKITFQFAQGNQVLV